VTPLGEVEVKLRREKMEEVKFVKPICKLTGTDRNVFNIIGQVSKALKKAGYKDKAEEFTTRAFNSESYDQVLQLCFDYVDVE